MASMLVKPKSKQEYIFLFELLKKLQIDFEQFNSLIIDSKEEFDDSDEWIKNAMIYFININRIFC